MPLKTTAWLFVSILLLGCGENKNPKRVVTVRDTRRAEYFLGDDADFSQPRQRQAFFNLLYSDHWVAVDEQNGEPFRGTTLNFSRSGVHPIFSLVLPDSTPPDPQYYERQYVGEIHEHSRDESTLEWIVLKPAQCGMSRLLFDSVQTTPLGTILRVSFVRSCGSSFVANRLNTRDQMVEIDEGLWSFQRVTEVQARLTAKQTLAPKKEETTAVAPPATADQTTPAKK